MPEKPSRQRRSAASNRRRTRYPRRSLAAWRRDRTRYSRSAGQSQRLYNYPETDAYHDWQGPADPDRTFLEHVYEAGIPKEQTQIQILSDLLDRAFDGSASNLVMRALAAKPASPKELVGIRDMIESARKKRGSSK